MQFLLRALIATVLSLIASSALQVFNDQNLFAFDAAHFSVIFIAIVLAMLVGELLPESVSFGGSDRETGTVKWFNVTKGFGFITRDNGEDIFVHFRSIEGKGRRVLYEGQKVEFIVTEGEKGEQAEKVSPVQ